jgi:hypothetical protein
MKWSDIVRVAAVLSFAHKALGFSQPAKSFARSKVVLPSTIPATKLDVGDNTDVASSSILAYSTVGSVGINKSGAMGEKIDYDKTVNNVMRRVEADMQILDVVVGGKTQLTGNEFLFLIACVASAGLSPLIFDEKVTEVLVPVAAAIPAAVGISSEYVGKISVFNGKEISACTLQAAAEAEAVLSGAERFKAVVPLCVGVSVTAGSFALIAPAFAHQCLARFGVTLAPEFYLIFPLISVLSAAVAGLSYQETQSLCGKAIGTGTRRFAKSSDIGRTWLSATELITSDSNKLKDKISTFAVGTLPAPLLAASLPGSIEFKGVVCATAAAAQAAFYLAGSEYEISKALDAVAIKSRAAAVRSLRARGVELPVCKKK